jgi:hypothetical protein
VLDIAKRPKWTHNPLVPGSSPGGPTNHPLSKFIVSNTLKSEDLERFNITYAHVVAVPIDYVEIMEVLSREPSYCNWCAEQQSGITSARPSSTFGP